MSEDQTQDGAVVEEETATAPVADEPAVVAATSNDEVKDESEEVEVPAKFKTLVEQVETMSVLELNELVKVLEKKFGVSASATAAAPVAGGAEADEQSTFSVVLADAGAQKIAVIKVIKEVLGLGLKEAKDLVDAAPSDIKTGVSKAESDELKAKLEEAGAKVTIK
jgi:large subunit ribosomal protein L7/L12